MFQSRVFQTRPRAVFIDVGFTLTSYDGTRIAALAGQVGGHVDAPAIEATERAMREHMLTSTWSFRTDDDPRLSAGAQFFRHMLMLAGIRIANGRSVEDVAIHVWQEHLISNTFRRVLPGVADALVLLRQAGLPLIVVSNSEGTVEAMLREVGLRVHLDAVLDSWTVGVAKPDPRIFAMALARAGVPSSEAVMIGDSPVADVNGAVAAGVPAALIDPFDFHTAASVPRFSDFATFADAVLHS